MSDISPGKFAFFIIWTLASVGWAIYFLFQAISSGSWAFLILIGIPIGLWCGAIPYIFGETYDTKCAFCRSRLKGPSYAPATVCRKCGRTQPRVGAS
jgi:Na+/melibiose symporter-like transporter